MKHKLLFLLLALLADISASAYSFCVNDIYYNKDGVNVAVTYMDNSYNSYSGDVTIPASVTYNGITYSVTSISNSAFRNCVDLTSVSIPASVTSIGWNSFEKCTGLTSIIIGKSVTSIGVKAFADCTALTSVSIPASVTVIGGYAFCGCSSLNSAKIPASVTSIGAYAFSGCVGLSSATIPDAVTTIGDYAFSNCTGLTSATIGASVYSIGSFAFRSCTGLKKVTVKNDNPANIFLGSYVFFDVPTATCVLCVPKGSQPLYATADQWADFKNMAEYQVVIPGDVNGDGVLSVSDAVSIVNFLLGNAPAGFVEDAADFNADGEISVSDVVEIINTILSGE